MTVLQALAARYDRLAARGEVSVPGFAPAKMSFCLVLNPAGEVVDVDDLRAGEGRNPRPRIINAPQPPKRTRGIASGAFWDKTSYVLGRGELDDTLPPEKRARAEKTIADEHVAFRARHEKLLSGTSDEGLTALMAFIENWSVNRYDTLRHADAMLDQNVCFRLDGNREFLHDRAAARAALDRETAAASGDSGLCLVTGAVGSIARLHPSIKGVPGAQSSGAALVSFNLDAFTSYGKSQGGNAPVSESAAFAYTTALNDLLSRSDGVDKKGRPRWRNRITLGDSTVVFWADAPIGELLIGDLFSPPSEELSATLLGQEDDKHTVRVKKIMAEIEALRPLADVAPDLNHEQFHILGLSPNAARLSVRFWISGTLGDLARRFQEHWRDMEIEPAAGKRPPALWALLYELAAQGKAENVPAHLAGEMTRAILTGGRYPASLLTQVIMRVRADQEVTPRRAALAKACLARNARNARKDPTMKGVPMSLDRQEPNVGYRLGRLFAVFESAQYAGIGKVNASVKDKFLAAASATPARIFPTLLRGAETHLSTARKKGKEGRAGRLTNETQDILAGLNAREPFPRILSLEDQGRFFVGFYHQGAELRVPRQPGEAVEAEETEEET
jgi:CRISPR-associated protein Csd1